MANHSHNASRKHRGSNEVGQFKEYVEDDRDESRRESFRHHYDQRESERNFHEHGTRNHKELESKLRELTDAETYGSERSKKAKSYKTTGSEDHHSLSGRVSYEITELEHLLHNLKASGKKGSVSYVVFEGYLREVKKLEHKFLELEESGSKGSEYYIELKHHLRLYVKLVREIREIQASGQQGSARYLEIEHQLHELQVERRNLGQGKTDKSYKTGGESTKYSTFTDNTTVGGSTKYSTFTGNKSGGESTKYSAFTDYKNGGEGTKYTRFTDYKNGGEGTKYTPFTDYKSGTGASRRTGNDGRSEISQLSYEIGEVEHQLLLLEESGKHDTKEQRELERRLSDLQEAMSRAEKRSYTTGAETVYRSNFSDTKSGATRRSRETDYYDNNTQMSKQTSDRHDTKSHSTKRTSGDDHHGHREHKSILTKRTAVETNNNQEDYSRHTEDHKSHNRRSSASSDNHGRRSSSGSGSGHHHHHHHQHGHCHRPKPEPTEKSELNSVPSKRPTPIQEEDECCIAAPSRKPLLLDDSCEPPPRKPTMVNDSSQIDPPKCDPPPKKPFMVNDSSQVDPPKCELPPKKPSMMNESSQVEPPKCEPPPRKPLLVNDSCQVEPPPKKSVMSCEPPPKKPLMVDDSCQNVPPPPVQPSRRLMADKNISAIPFIPDACEPEPPLKPVPTKSCKMVADKPVGASSSFLSYFVPRRQSTTDSCQIEEPPACPTKPEVVSQAVSCANFPPPPPPPPPPKSCLPKPPPPACPPKPPACPPKPPACPPKPIDPCQSSHHMMDTAVGRSYLASDTGVGVSYPALAKIKSIYQDDDDDLDLFPDREEDLDVPVASEYPLDKDGYYVREERVDEVMDPNLCPYCGTGVFVKKTSAAGYLAAVLCFPCGLYCCLTQTCCYIIECTYCHATTEKSAEDMNKSHTSPHRGTRESLQDIRSVYELELEESTEDEWARKNGRRYSRDRIDRDRDDRDRRDRDKYDRDRNDNVSNTTRNDKDVNQKTRNDKNTNRNYKEERHDRDMYEKDRTVRNDRDKSDSDRKSRRFSR